MKRLETWLLLFAAVMALVLTPDCAWWNAKGKGEASAIVDCAEKALAAQAPALAKQLYELLDSSPAGWETGIAALEAAGMSALGCAALAVYTDFQMKAQVSAKAGNALGAAFHGRKAAFLAKYLSRRRLVFAVGR